MFVLLEHRSAGDVHWDFLVGVPGQAGLATWRLAGDPTQTAAAVLAERIADHHPAFLDYEGPLRRAPGAVRRLDRGPARATRWADPQIQLELDGTRLRGTYEIGLCAGGQLEFRRAAPRTAGSAD
jgi:hypothetical protein